MEKKKGIRNHSDHQDRKILSEVGINIIHQEVLESCTRTGSRKGGEVDNWKDTNTISDSFDKNHELLRPEKNSKPKPNDIVKGGRLTAATKLQIN